MELKRLLRSWGNRHLRPNMVDNCGLVFTGSDGCPLFYRFLARCLGCGGVGISTNNEACITSDIVEERFYCVPLTMDYLYIKEL